MKIFIKKASIKDANFFYDLRNEKKARSNFFNQKIIKYNAHLKWYKEKLKKKNTILLIAFINSYQKIGYIKYEIKELMADVSLNIGKAFRKLGYGSKILKESEKFLKNNLMIIARVKSRNKASIKIFKKNNYKIVKENNNTVLIKII